jgi:hypothetical protein
MGHDTGSKIIRNFCIAWNENMAKRCTACQLICGITETESWAG